jgi:hypothetical protein
MFIVIPSTADSARLHVAARVPETVEKRRRRALLIGINNYPDEASRLKVA